MKNILLPRFFMPIGWVIFIPALIMGALVLLDMLSSCGSISGIVNDSIIVGIALGALFIVCSRERVEDEMTRSIRLSSLLNSIYIYVILLVTCTILLNGADYEKFTTLNLVLLPIIFVWTFRVEMHRYYKMCENEE